VRACPPSVRKVACSSRTRSRATAIAMKHRNRSHYSAERLFTPTARQSFVQPDIAPIPPRRCR
jgi:hypothetical protein